MQLQILIQEIKETIPMMLDQSGSIVYSSVNSICKGDLYIMGLNPGGQNGDKIRETLDKLLDKYNNSYEDDSPWGNKKRYMPGQHPLQKNYKSLKSYLNADKEIFSTNLIFTQSENERGANYNINAKTCWEVHKQLIKIIDPKCFIVFGIGPISPYNYIKDNYGLLNADSVYSEHGNWYVYSAETIVEGKNRLIIGVPHLSIYSISTKPNVMKWIKDKIDDFKN